MQRRTFTKLVGIGAIASGGLMAYAGKASAQAPGKILVIIRHPVADYAGWRKVYDEVDPIRRAANVTGAEVFRNPEDGNDVTVLHRFPSLDVAKTFIASPGLKDAMMKAGVKAPPTFTFVEAA
jgi:hypothetical protein